MALDSYSPFEEKPHESFGLAVFLHFNKVFAIQTFSTYNELKR